ncbi:MAG: NUMOD3 domain-containing DNA-binding protein [Sarcina sp.]
MNHYVYEITNLINGKKYIGKRSCECLIEKDKYMGSGKLIRLAILKYGLENFDKKILKICDTDEEAYNIEKEYIENVKAWSNPMYYNIVGGGKGCGCGERNHFYGKKHSDEVRERFKGKNNPMYGRVGKLNPFYGKKHSDETIQIIIKKNKEKKISDETREKLRIAAKGKKNNFYGKKHSRETIEILREKNMGKNSVHSKKVVMLNKENGEYIKQFDGMREAGRFINKGHASISEVCRGLRISAHGYRWQYLNDYLKNIEPGGM